MSTPRQAALERVIAELGYTFDGEIRIGGDYVSVVRDGATAYVSGQEVAIGQVLRVGVYVQSAVNFTQQSEVADAASALLKTVLGDAGAHTRTSIGVYQLPKNASVELDMVVSTREVPHGQ